MIKQQPKHTLITARCNFVPQLDFGVKIPDSMKRVREIMGMDDWLLTTNTGRLRRKTKPDILIIVTHGGVQIQTLGISPWLDQIEIICDSVEAVFEVFDLKQCTAQRVHTTSFLDIGMKHSEITELFFGSLILPREVYESYSDGEIYDLKFTVYSQSENRQNEILASPIKEEEVTESLKRFTNITQFNIGEFDTNISEWNETLARDGFCVDIDQRVTDIDLLYCRKFFREAIDAADKIATDLVQRLKSLPPKRKPI